MLLWYFFRFYWQAVTKYQIHAPFAYALVEALLEDKRWYYAFGEIEALRKKMLQSDVRLVRTDYGTGAGHTDGKTVTLRSLVKGSASSPRQGRRLFRLAHYFQVQNILELGTSTGIGTMYLASAARKTRFISLEGCPNTAAVAQTNLELLHLDRVAVRVGPFESTLPVALQDLMPLGMVYLDGNHRLAPTLSYFEASLVYSQDQTVFIFDDIYWSAEMMAAWQQLKAHPRVRMTIDFFDFGLVFIDPAIKVQQHLKVVPLWWKPWIVF